MNVYPRKPLEAKHRDFTNMGCPWSVMFTDEGPNLHYTDAEFAEHFYDARLLDRVLSAVKRLAEDRTSDTAVMNVCSAWRAYDEAAK
jgi:hypothetical protein